LLTTPTVVGLITGDDKKAYREEVSDLAVGAGTTTSPSTSVRPRS
jgi:hypothetical protein